MQEERTSRNGRTQGCGTNRQAEILPHEQVEAQGQQVELPRFLLSTSNFLLLFSPLLVEGVQTFVASENRERGGKVKKRSKKKETIIFELTNKLRSVCVCEASYRRKYWERMK